MEQVFYIDLKAATTKEKIHEAIAKELPLPDYYGGNLDALYDVLTEEGEGWNIIFYNLPVKEASSTGTDTAGASGTGAITSETPEDLANYLSKLQKMCARAASECDNLQIRFYP